MQKNTKKEVYFRMPACASREAFGYCLLNHNTSFCCGISSFARYFVDLTRGGGLWLARSLLDASVAGISRFSR
jgi:hypothetical protein